MNSRILAPILFLGSLTFACLPQPKGAADAKPAAATSRKKSPGDQPLATTFDVSVAGDSAGRPGPGIVRFALHITNTTTRQLELDFPNGQTHDFVVLDSAGQELWRWSRGRMFTQTVQNRLVGSRETVTFEDSWSAPTPRGRLTAVAILNSTNFRRETRVEFALP
ncbi:MAG TPA: BsuPI-related putative proteinase inhibitor [Gemmatimonadaceae bacterium]|nr:BsuPI-related putative proteinase inhibitor [Gemmatimonadaceae bacterium]